MTPRPPQSEELKAQVTLVSRQFLEAFIALMNDYGSRPNPDDQATLDITMSKFNDMATMMSDKMLALIAQRERAAIRDFGEKVKQYLESKKYQDNTLYNPELPFTTRVDIKGINNSLQVYINNIDKLMGEDHA